LPGCEQQVFGCDRLVGTEAELVTQRGRLGRHVMQPRHQAQGGQGPDA